MALNFSAGETSIGCGETQNMSLLSEMIASFRQQYPDVRFHIYTAIADDVKERLENGTLDMVLLLEPEIESGCVLAWKKNLTLSLAMIRFTQHVKEYLDRKG